MSADTLSLYTLHEEPEGWPLRQLRIPEAHATTLGADDVIVAVVDLGYRAHPEHKGHLWNNLNHGAGATHGWDCHDDDESLEYSDVGDGLPESDYLRDHHSFVVGEVMACAPASPVMIVRVGDGDPASWARGIDWAVTHGANVLVIPHGFISHGRNSPLPLFYRGTDFSYPTDNPELRRAIDDAGDAGGDTGDDDDSEGGVV